MSLLLGFLEEVPKPFDKSARTQAFAAKVASEGVANSV